MAFVQFSRVCLAFGGRDILKDVNLRLVSGKPGSAAGSRCCLAGANGSGKSTLMKIIAGVLISDSGDFSAGKGTRVSYLPQSGIVHRGKTLRYEAETAFGFIHALFERLDKTGEQLQKAENSEGAVKNLIEEHHNLQEQIEASGYYRREAEIFMVLSGLGFSSDDLNRGVEEFSGGWQMRIALAKVLLEKPDILLLDEPTNYLDIEARSWLENWLNGFSGGYLLVSHDRYFLDVCVNEVCELFNGNLKRYAGNYSSYEKTRQTELESLVKRYEEQQEEIIKTEALIRRFRYKASKATFAQELIKRLDKMERVEIPESLKKININFPPAPHSGNIAITLEGIGKSYGQRSVLDGLDLCLESGERLVVAGPNGAGKTTLLRIIAGTDIEYEGKVKYGTGVKTGYFSQDAAEAMDSKLSIIEYMENEASSSPSSSALIPKLRDMLGAFLFRGDDVYKSVSVLSGGEKSRLALLKMFLKPMNLLILDEPTNHLDLYSKDILLDALEKFTGTVIFVSHDRFFMEALSTKTLELAPEANSCAAKARLFYGNYSYYLEKTNTQVSAAKEPPSVDIPRLSADNEQRRMAEKQKQSVLRKLQKQESAILFKLDEHEKEKKRLEAEMERPEIYSIGQKVKEIKQKINDCRAAIEMETKEWEAVTEVLSSLSSRPD